MYIIFFFYLVVPTSDKQSRRSVTMRSHTKYPYHDAEGSSTPVHASANAGGQDGRPALAAQLHCNQMQVHLRGDSTSCQKVRARSNAPDSLAKGNARGE